MFRALPACSLSLLVCACTGLPPPRPSAPPAPAAQALPVQGSYRIDPAQSELRVLVYRAGPLASFGHNHVMLNRALSGSVTVGADLRSSAFALSVPVAQFSVDEALARTEEGDDFPGEVPAAAREATLHNMLAPALLDAEIHPRIEIRSTQLLAEGGELNAQMVLTVAGRDASLRVPFALTPLPGGIGVRADFEVRQTELGLTPMSLLAGALQVRDAMRIKLMLKAVPSP